MPVNPKYLARFKSGACYHVYNRCHSDKKMFSEKRNYYFFMDLFKQYMLMSVDLLAYCLIPNHFHLLIEVKEDIDGFGDKHKFISISSENYSFHIQML